MIRPAQVALVERARAYLSGRDHPPAVLALFPEPTRGAELTVGSFGALMDRCLLAGFRDRRWPILSLRTRQLAEVWRKQARISDHVFTTHLRGSGAADLRELSGTGLLILLGCFEEGGMSVPAFQAERGRIDGKRIALVQIARKEVGMENAKFYRVLQEYGGANSTTDLDQRGFDLVMAFLEAEGFQRSRPSLAASSPPATTANLGQRAGFASPEQLALIRDLWREWSGADDEAALSTWLDRFHGVSALRFLKVGPAGKVITALKAMKRRRRNGENAA